MPGTCRNSHIIVPINMTWLMWGWPNRFLQRMSNIGSEVILIGPHGAGDPGTSGIDTLEDLARVPDSFSRYIWTNRIEIIGPASKSAFN